MSAALSYTTDANGVKTADFFSVRESAWHNEGKILLDNPGLDDALLQGQLDYRVEKLELTIGEYGVSKKAFVTFRKDRKIELGSVGPDYTIVQNRDAFAATIGPLIDSGILKLETGGVLRDGADAWLLGKLDLSQFGPIAQEVFASEVQPYVLVSVNHSGRRGNTIALTMIRVVCANTLSMVETQVDGRHAKSTVVRHTGEAQKKMVAAAEKLFGNLVHRAEVVAESYKLLKATELTASQFRQLVLLPSIGVHPTRRKGWNPEARQAESVIERYEAKGAEVVRLWEKGDGHVGDHSAWEAYNGLVQAIDHNTELFPMRGGVYRTQGLLDGILREMKDKALDAVTEYAGAVQVQGQVSAITSSAEERAYLTFAK